MCGRIDTTRFTHHTECYLWLVFFARPGEKHQPKKDKEPCRRVGERCLWRRAKLLWELLMNPEPPPQYATDRESLERDSDITFFVAGGPGGQHRNKVASGVR